MPKCSICKKNYEGYGNNAMPVNKSSANKNCKL